MYKPHLGWSSLSVSRHKIVSLDRISCMSRLPLIRFTTLPKANPQHSAIRGFLVGPIQDGAEKTGGSLQRFRPNRICVLYSKCASLAGDNRSFSERVTYPIRSLQDC